MTVVALQTTPAISHNRDGGRTVFLYVPFEGIDAITLAPMTFGHHLDWRDGRYNNGFELMCNMAGVSEDIMRKLRYPDIDRVMSEFFVMVTVDIRDDVVNNFMPMPFVPDPEPEPEEIPEDIAAQITKRIFDPAPPPGFPDASRDTIVEAQPDFPDPEPEPEKPKSNPQFGMDIS